MKGQSMNANPLQQYIDLAREHRDLLESGSPAVMNALRDRAAEVCASVELPRDGSRPYLYTSLRRMFAPDLGVNISRLPFSATAADAFRCRVPNISTAVGIVANDTFADDQPGLSNLGAGVTVCSLRRAATLMPEVLQRHYGTIVDIEDMRNGDRAAVALNTLLAQDGILVHVARGVHVDRTIQLVQVLNAAAPTLAVRRMLIVLEAGADASLLLCDHTAPGAAASTISQVTEVYLGEDASLSLYTLEESASDTSRLCRTGVRTGRGARLSMTPVTLLCGTSRNNIAVSLEGEGAECNINGMALADGSMVADNNSVVYHKAPRCTTLQNFRYVVDDQARGSFEGMIHVAEGAHHTNGEQNNRNVLLSDGARMHSLPQLEIYCDDVKCGHGSATGRLDERQMFYMQSRGIPAAEARTMLIQAFMADNLDAIRLEPLRLRLQMLVDNRLRRDVAPSGCADCNICPQ